MSAISIALIVFLVFIFFFVIASYFLYRHLMKGIKAERELVSELARHELERERTKIRERLENNYESTVTGDD